MKMNEITTVPYDLVVMYCSEFSKMGAMFGVFAGFTLAFIGHSILNIISYLIEKHKNKKGGFKDE